MARGYKLKASAVRKIFSSTEPAPAIAKRFGVSTNLIYLIRQGRVHKKITGGMAAPARARGGRAIAAGIDLTTLADAIIDRLVLRLSARAGRRAPSVRRPLAVDRRRTV